jgi:hypothetical protein
MNQISESNEYDEPRSVRAATRLALLTWAGA